ncbi:helix-turn-helix domain-containing protein [Loktanella sp. Alg231-35]|uniref:helix-turn-helix domain-containing protein n=1 Tax=Loktanella sp. Alg231-35 TaxID=1922220 RepID=UPI000D55F766|nr:AraC family transcriptional regulator [Loktanella sp. Alg231-35]
MTELPAFCVYRDFPPEDDKTIQFDRHYLLYAAKGTMRLQADGRTWTLPPARAALIAAGAPITLSIATTITCCSALFSPGSYDAPAATLRVLDMSPLARELILACRTYGPDATDLDNDGRQLFDTLYMLATRAAAAPNAMWMPVAKSQAVRKAQSLTEAHIAEAPSFAEIATAVSLTERTLARRFQDEIGMSWRDFLRRLRMIRAVEGLSDPTRQVTQVAHDVGYRSSSAFNAAFLDFTGQTPTSFRASL